MLDSEKLLAGFAKRVNALFEASYRFEGSNDRTVFCGKMYGIMRKPETASLLFKSQSNMGLLVEVLKDYNPWFVSPKIKTAVEIIRSSDSLAEQIQACQVVDTYLRKESDPNSYLDLRARWNVANDLLAMKAGQTDNYSNPWAYHQERMGPYDLILRVQEVFTTPTVVPATERPMKAGEVSATLPVGAGGPTVPTARPMKAGEVSATVSAGAGGPTVPTAPPLAPQAPFLAAVLAAGPVVSQPVPSAPPTEDLSTLAGIAASITAQSGKAIPVKPSNISQPFQLLTLSISTGNLPCVDALIILHPEVISENISILRSLATSTGILNDEKPRDAIRDKILALQQNLWVPGGSVNFPSW